MKITVGARSSPLSRAQVQEVQVALHHLHLSPIYIETIGDRDQITSLRTMGKSDFFTREVDQLLLSGKCDIAIHSAKDLPQPLPNGLQLVALTRGVDSSDSLVLPPGLSLSQLPTMSRIGTSSFKREEAVRAIRSDVAFIDIRGTIAQRLEKLERGEVEGVVVAEAALIRLQLTQLNRITLPGETTPMQGQLAILARDDDHLMQQLFGQLDVRKRILYLGLEVPPERYLDKIMHYPVIEVIPRNCHYDLKKFTHIIVTSKNVVRFLTNLPKTACYIAVGKSTAAELQARGVVVQYMAQEECAEGVVKLLDSLELEDAHLFWPHSSLSRSVISDYLTKRKVRFESCVLYDTLYKKTTPIPHLEDYDEIVFTSPSTVQGFLNIYGSLPSGIKLTSIGPITERALQDSSQWTMDEVD